MMTRSTKWSSLLIVSMMKITMHLTRSQKKHAASMKGENNSFFYYYFLFLFFIIRFSSVPASSPYLLPPLHSSSRWLASSSLTLLLSHLFPLSILACLPLFFHPPSSEPSRSSSFLLLVRPNIEVSVVAGGTQITKRWRQHWRGWEMLWSFNNSSKTPKM